MILYFAPPRFCPTTIAVLTQSGARCTHDPLADWDLYLTSDSNKLGALLPSRTDQWIGRMPGAGHLANKAALWRGLVSALGRNRAGQLMPQTWLLNHPPDRSAIEKQHQHDFYIAKEPILDQRRGLKLCADLPAVFTAAEEGLTVIQRLLPDLLLVGGHRFHLRLYVLLMRQDRQFSVWCHRLGRCIWAPEPMGETLLEADAVITRGSALLPGRPITMRGLLALLNGIDPDSIRGQIDALLRQVIDAIAPRMHRSWSLAANPSFHLLGADVVIDVRGGVKLIELNSGPDLRPRNAEDGQLKSAMVTDIFRLLGLLPERNEGFRLLRSTSSAV